MENSTWDILVFFTRMLIPFAYLFLAWKIASRFHYKAYSKSLPTTNQSVDKCLTAMENLMSSVELIQDSTNKKSEAVLKKELLPADFDKGIQVPAGQWIGEE